MISNKVIGYCKVQGWWYEDASSDYEAELNKININTSTDFGQFYLHVEDGPTFMSRGKEIYQLCWFLKNTNFDLAMERTHQTLELPPEYIPLDSFEGEQGFFYNRKSGEVLDLSLGNSLVDFKKGLLTPQWKSFNEFLEYFFELS